ncbi:precorrin-6A synthase (deacetylating) [Bradyrhizobium sp. i1.7.7]
MLTLSLIGIGCGDPEQLTRAAVQAINAADLILIPRKGTAKSDLADLRRTICADVLTNQTTRIAEFDLPVRDAGEADYHKGVDDWHEAVAAAWSQTIASHLGDDGKVALLIWGDPSLYDSSLRIARRLDPLPDIEVVPGITSIQALCAAHALPLNDIGEPFLVTTGRRLREGGWPQGVDTVVVMLDGGTAFPVARSCGAAHLVGRLSRHARSDRHVGRSGRDRPAHHRRATGCARAARLDHGQLHSQAQAVSEAACSLNGSPGNAPMSPLSIARRRSRVRRN